MCQESIKRPTLLRMILHFSDPKIMSVYSFMKQDPGRN